MTQPQVVAIGGGHGLAMVLRAARGYAGALTAIVSTADDGGSTGRLRADLDMPAPGDLRRCLAAVAGDTDLADAFEHRFASGDLAGHAVGNLVLAGLVDAGLDLTAAAARVSRWLDIDDAIRVLPATAEPVELVAQTPAGEVRGQVAVEGIASIIRIATDPGEPTVPSAALAAIDAADQVVLGPGSFFTSVVATAAVPAIRDAIAATRGRLVFVCNLRADEAGVKDFDVARHVAVLADHGLQPDVVVAQRDALPLGNLAGAVVVEADIDRPHGLAHDSALLGQVLAELL